MTDDLADVYEEARLAAEFAGANEGGPRPREAARAASDVWARYYREKEAEVDDKSAVGHAVVDRWMAHAKDLDARLQFVIDWADREGLLEDGCFTFPDGLTLWATGREG